MAFIFQENEPPSNHHEILQDLSSPKNRSILKKPSGREDEMQPLEEPESNITDSVLVYVLAACLVTTAILSCGISCFVSEAISMDPEEAGTSLTLTLECNYCQVAWGAVLFYEILLCLGSEDVQLSKVLLYPLCNMVINVVIYSGLANGRLPLLHSSDGRAFNTALCLLWATSSPLAIFLFGRITHHPHVTRADLLTASALASALPPVSLLASLLSPTPLLHAPLLALALALWAALLRLLPRLLRAAAARLAAARAPPAVSLDVLLLSWAAVPTLSLLADLRLRPTFVGRLRRPSSAWDRRTDCGLLLARSLPSPPRSGSPPPPTPRAARTGLAGAGATTVCAPRPSSAPPLPPTPPSAPPLAAGDGAAGPTTTSHAFAPLRHRPLPPMRPGMVPHGGQSSVVCWGPYPHTLSGRGRALPTSQWSWAVCRAALGVPDRRTVPPLTASGTFSGADRAGAAVGGSPSAPCALRGPVPVCPAQLVRRPLGWYRGAGSPAARGCDGRGETWPGSASQPPTASRRGRLRPAIDRCSRAPGPFKLGRSYGRVGARAVRPRMPISLCGPVAR